MSVRAAWPLACLAAAMAVAAGAPDSAAPAGAARPDLRGKYLDMHCHTAGIGAGGSGCFASPALRDGWKFGIYLKAFGVTRKELEQHGDGLILERISAGLQGSRSVGAAVILALDGVVDSAGRLDTARTQVYIPNAFLAREVPRHPRLLWGASINPLRRDALEELARVRAQGAVLMKWIPSIQLFDPGDTALAPFYLALKSMGMPLLCHTGKESSFKEARDEFCDPRRLELALSLGVTVIAAHVATLGKNEGQDNTERLMTMFAGHPNLYADISSLTQINKLGKLGRILARPECRGRLIYGTDFPLIETLLVSPYYYAFSLKFGRMRAVAREENTWDRDVALKKALGMPEEIFTRSAELLLPK